MIKNRNYILLILLIGVLSNCEAADRELIRYIKHVKAKPAKPLEPIPPVLPLTKFTYPEQKWGQSPFKQKIIEKPLHLNSTRSNPSLEAFPIEVLKFVGNMQQGTKVWGLIKLPNGEITCIRLGDYIGPNETKVIGISERALTLEQTIQVTGKWKKKSLILDLNSHK